MTNQKQTSHPHILWITIMLHWVKKKNFQGQKKKKKKIERFQSQDPSSTEQDSSTASAW